MDLAEILKGLASNDVEELTRQEEALHEFFGELDPDQSPTLEKVLMELRHYIGFRIKGINERGA